MFVFDPYFRRPYSPTKLFTMPWLVKPDVATEGRRNLLISYPYWTRKRTKISSARIISLYHPNSIVIKERSACLLVIIKAWVGDFEALRVQLGYRWCCKKNILQIHNFYLKKIESCFKFVIQKNKAIVLNPWKLNVQLLTGYNNELVKNTYVTSGY